MKTYMLFSYFLAAACGVEDISSTSSAVRTPIALTLQTEASCDELSRDSYVLSEPSLDGNTLTLTLETSGGLREHQYSACTTGAASNEFDANLPGTVQIWIGHEANRDPGRARLVETLAIDVSSLAEADLDITVPAHSYPIELQDYPDLRLAYPSAGATQKIRQVFLNNQEQALLISEADYRPKWLQTDYEINRRQSYRGLRKRVGAQILAYMNDRAIDEWAFLPQENQRGAYIHAYSPAQSRRWLLRLTARESYDATDFGLKAWQGWNNIVAALTDDTEHVRVFRVGDYRDDRGFYAYVVVAKAGDGQLVGFVVGSVET